MLDTALPSAVFIAIVLSLIPHDMMYGPQAALIAEAFTPRLRYSGASLGYQLASIIAGGPAPLIATALFAAYHTGYAIAIYIAGLRGDQPGLGGADAGLHRPGHLGRIRRGHLNDAGSGRGPDEQFAQAPIAWRMNSRFSGAVRCTAAMPRSRARRSTIVVAEQPIERIGRRQHQQVVRPALPLVAPQQVRRAGIVAGA